MGTHQISNNHRMKTGIKLITAERERQISEEGWSLEHDDQHANAEMASAARCYLGHALGLEYGLPRQWPWNREWWKPAPSPISDLVKAGALIAAEIDRLQRREAKPAA